MSKKRKRKMGQCVYCGKVRLLTDDHIPPQNLFPKPRPGSLIRVPSCEPCNGGASKDDEYFRLFITVREDAKGHPDRDAVLPVVLRSLNRPEARGFAKAFWKNTRYAERMSPSGLFLSSGRVYEAEGRRMDRVAVRIVKGLVFHETHKRVPDDHKVQPIHLSQVSCLPSPYRETTEECIQALLQEEPE